MGGPNRTREVDQRAGGAAGWLPTGGREKMRRLTAYDDYVLARALTAAVRGERVVIVSPDERAAKKLLQRARKMLKARPAAGKECR